MTIAIVTDSTAQIDAALAAELEVLVVPITITIDGVDHQEGVDLDPDGFYDTYVEGETAVTTAAPTPGRLAEAYDDVIATGATAILSIHVGAGQSATCTSAALAAELVDVPVEIVDTGLASFGVAMVVMAAVDARTAGGDLSACAAAARSSVASIGSVFVLDAGALPRRSGRFEALGLETRADEAPSAEAGEGVPVYFFGGGEFAEVGVATDDAEAADLMANRILEARPARVASGLASEATAELTDLLDAALAAAGVQVRRYRVGPSVAAHTGPRTAGAFFVAEASAD